MTCSNCGAENKADASFCSRCGIQLAGVRIHASPDKHPVSDDLGWRRQAMQRFVESVRVWVRNSSFRF